MTVKAKIRLDYKVAVENRSYLWPRRDPRDAAKKVRAEQVSLLKNLPFQGLSIEELDSEHEVYLVPEESSRHFTAYAPVELVVCADSIGDLMQLTLKEEFRKIKILEPREMSLTNAEMERVLFQISEEYLTTIE